MLQNARRNSGSTLERPSCAPFRASRIRVSADAHTREQMGFEFRQRRALPVISGIVVAEEHADTLEAVSRQRVHRCAFRY